MELQEQQIQEVGKNQLKSILKLHANYAFKNCTKRCITNFKSGDLSDKEKICLSKCYDRKTESFSITSDTLNSYIDVSKKNPGQSQNF